MTIPSDAPGDNQPHDSAPSAPFVSELGTQIMDLEIDSIDPNPWNPNAMDDESFNTLAEEIDDVGFISPIQVVPMDTGRYMIIGGEHRWRVCRTKGFTKIPAVVLSGERWHSEDLQKFVTTRLNMLHGKLNPQKFAALYKDLASRHEENALRRLMGFTDEELFKKMTKNARDALVDRVPKKVLEGFDNAVREAKTVDDLSGILNRLFRENGSQLDSNFMVLSFGGKKHTYIRFDDPKVFAGVMATIEGCTALGKKADDLISEALAAYV